MKSYMPARTIGDLLRHRAAATPDDLAYCFLRNGEAEEGAVSFHDLDRQAASVGAALAARGVRACDRVLIVLPQGLAYVVALFGCWRGGLVAVPCYPPTRAGQLRRLQAVAADCAAKVLVCDRSAIGSLAASPEVAASGCAVYAIEDLMSADPTGGPEGGHDLDAVAILQYTSGSTGSPKGVMVSHGNVAANQVCMGEAFQPGERPAIVSWLPLFHDMGLIHGLLYPFFFGGTGYLMSPLAFLQKPVRWLAAIGRYRAEMSGGPNFAYDLCIRETSVQDRARLDLSAWKTAFNGAEPVRADTLDRFAAAFAPSGFDAGALHPCYGLAEATLMATARRGARGPRVAHVEAAQLAAQERARAVDACDAGAQAVVGCGLPPTGAKLRIVDPQAGTALAPWQVGEVWLAGEHIARGYWNNPQASAQTFAAHRADGDGPYMRTGDLGFVDDTGELFLTSRLKDLIILRGRNYSPSDLEVVVEKAHPGIRENGVAAFTVPGASGEVLAIAAEVRAEAARDFDPAAATRQLRAAVSAEFDLRVEKFAFVRRGKLPRTTSGKIQRAACRAALLGDELVPFDRGLPAAGTST